MGRKTLHPFKNGQKVRCVHAPEAGNPLDEGQVYTILRTFIGPPACTEAPIPGMGKTPGVEVEEWPRSYFTADRFEPAT